MKKLILILFIATECFAAGKVIGYFTHYQRSYYPADSLEVNNVTHVIHAFIWANTDGTVYTPTDFVYPALNTKVHNAGKKILVCLGSDGISVVANFRTVISDSSKRATFVSNLVAFLDTNNYDGIDLDWESPANSTDRANYLSFVTQLRSAFRVSHPSWLITMAVTINDYWGQWFNYESMTQYIDWYGMMGYDISGAGSSNVWFNAPLYPDSINTWDGSDNDGITYLSVTRGIPKSKIVLLMPFYGYIYFGTSGYMQKFSGGGQYTYSNIADTIAKGGFTRHWSRKSQVPFSFNSTRKIFISYDDTASIHKKISYAINKGLAGVGIWTLNCDLVSGHQPLLETIGKYMINEEQRVRLRK